MKKRILLLLVFSFSFMNAQSDKFWKKYDTSKGKIIQNVATTRESFPKQFDLYELNIDELRSTLFASLTNKFSQKTIIALPNVNGEIEQFEVFEASNFEPDLQAQFPEIRAYSGKGITDKYATLKLSISPQGIQTMVFRTDKENEFIEAYSQDKTVYAVFKSQREKGKLAWTCSTDDQKLTTDVSSTLPNTGKSSAGQLKTMRLAQSCTAEYSNYFGATSSAQVALVLAAFNATLTRCNGVYEKDLALHLNLVASSTNVIFYDPATDPYSAASVGTASANSANNLGWNIQLQNTLSSSLTGAATTLAANNAAYDIGHLFGASGGGGNAGCIGCVCTDDIAGDNKNKGSGFTSPGNGIPQGDSFDIDYVVHEVGHQLGGNHTFSHGNEGTGVNVEPGSGVTIMGYAGITPYDVAAHSIDVYHAATIAQIQANLAGKSCPITTAIGANNATPVANAGADYTIPINTPFVLTGSATDANVGDALTYTWEQNDDGVGQTATNSGARVNKPTGPNWRSYSPSSSPVRYMPQMSSILANQPTTAGVEINVEALSSVARTLNFRLTVRDNVAYSASAPVKVGQTSFDDMVITTDATIGPLTVSSQNVAGQSWVPGSTQTVTWTVNNTNTIAGATNVDILLSTDGGLTFPTVLAAATPNDGTETITVPATLSTSARIMVKASGNIFFNVNTVPILIGYTATTTCNTYTNSTPLVVPDNTPASPVTNTISVPATGTLSDVNISLNVAHTYPRDLNIRIIHPDATQDIIWANACNGNDNFNVVLSDGSPAFTCVAAMSGTFAPSNPLSVFNNKPSNGTWTLSAYDNAPPDAGSIVSWSVEVCTTVYTLSTNEFEFADFALYPNPNKGDFTVKFTSASSNDIKINVHDMRGRQVYEKSFSNNGAFNQNINLDKVQAGIYLVSIMDGAKKTVKRIVVE